jgi:hypothetical protein
MVRVPKFLFWQRDSITDQTGLTFSISISRGRKVLSFALSNIATHYSVELSSSPPGSN